ncbi:hypothetical protein HKX48_004921 [Thoreauomyces humboldtii]|nr:hypothetical protein HKX48_004921 [Thoreauomyces humboldtii]
MPPLRLWTGLLFAVSSLDFTTAQNVFTPDFIPFYPSVQAGDSPQNHLREWIKLNLNFTGHFRRSYNRWDIFYIFNMSDTRRLCDFDEDLVRSPAPTTTYSCGSGCTVDTATAPYLKLTAVQIVCSDGYVSAVYGNDRAYGPVYINEGLGGSVGMNHMLVGDATSLTSIGIRSLGYGCDGTVAGINGNCRFWGDMLRCPNTMFKCPAGQVINALTLTSGDSSSTTNDPSTAIPKTIAFGKGRKRRIVPTRLAQFENLFDRLHYTQLQHRTQRLHPAVQSELYGAKYRISTTPRRHSCSAKLQHRLELSYRHLSFKSIKITNFTSAIGTMFTGGTHCGSVMTGIHVVGCSGDDCTFGVKSASVCPAVTDYAIVRSRPCPVGQVVSGFRLYNDMQYKAFFSGIQWNCQTRATLWSTDATKTLYNTVTATSISVSMSGFTTTTTVPASTIVSTSTISGAVATVTTASIVNATVTTTRTVNATVTTTSTVNATVTATSTVNAVASTIISTTTATAMTVTVSAAVPTPVTVTNTVTSTFSESAALTTRTQEVTVMATTVATSTTTLTSTKSAATLFAMAGGFGRDLAVVVQNASAVATEALAAIVAHVFQDDVLSAII